MATFTYEKRQVIYFMIKNLSVNVIYAVFQLHTICTGKELFLYRQCDVTFLWLHATAERGQRLLLRAS